MSHKDQRIREYVFPRSTIKDMEKAISKTEKSGREHAFSLCKDKDNKIYSGVHHSENNENGNNGKEDRREIGFTARCRERSHEHTGTFHTHPSTKSTELSALDLYNNCDERNDIDCIGSPMDGKIICLTKNNHIKSCQDEVKYLVTAEDILLNVRESPKEVNSDTLYNEVNKVIHKNFELNELH